MYDTVDEANQKLSNTVVMFDGDPVFVMGADGSRNHVKLVVVALEDWERRADNKTTEDIDDERFDFRNLGGRLGNINHPHKMHESIFCYRVGVRKAQQTQGLSEVNVHFVSSSVFVGRDRHRWQPRFEQFIGKPGLIKTLKGNYPTISQIKKLMAMPDNGIYSMAFHRKFSIRQDPVGPFYLQYKALDIGYSTDLEKFHLGEQFGYLDETLADLDGIKIAT